MKGNYDSLVTLAQEIERVESAKQDYVSDTRSIRMADDNLLSIEGQGTFLINSYAHGQIASKLKIPKVYYDSMIELPGLRAYNVNEWFYNKPERRMIRTLDGNMRAYLSDRFKPIDNAFVAQALWPTLEEHHEKIQLKTSAITERRLYMQIVFPGISAPIVGDTVRAGITIINSEVGCSAFDIQGFIEILSCLNGMVGKSLLKKYHIGRKIGDSEEDYRIYSDETMMAELHSLKLRIRDVVRYALKEDVFRGQVDRFRSAQGEKIENVRKAVENVTKRYQFNLTEQDRILDNIVDRGDNSKWGLAQGITVMAHQTEDIDRQYEYEKIGQQVINLPNSQWDSLVA